MNDRGIKLIMNCEGLRLTPYICPAGKPTIGYGTTVYPTKIKVKMTDKAITKEQAYNFLLHDIIVTEKGLRKYLTKELNENQISALVSFAYNVGLGNFSKSTLLKKINVSPNDTDIHEQFIRWVKITKNGKKEISNGLIIRRLKESKLYFTTI